jgi:hypothetical protein
MLKRRKRSVSPPEPDAASGNEESKQVRAQVEPQNNAAMIPAERMESLKQVADAFSSTGNGGVKGFSMNELLKMDDSTKGLPEILGVPIGAQENDMYRMLYRCRLTKHEKTVFIQAIHLAEHGFGYAYKGINLDFPVPFYGERIVKELRASVSVDGESLATFERTTSTWVAKLYASQQQTQQQLQRGIIQ